MNASNATSIALRCSPAYNAQQRYGQVGGRGATVQWTVLENMQIAERFGADDDRRAARLGIADLSHLHRIGFKGRDATEWLAQQGLPVPAAQNTWLPLAHGGLIARLGATEYLIEDGLAGRTSAKLAHREPALRLYPVPRQDLALALYGNEVSELLLQTCNVNFGALELEARPVVLTSMAGVAVTVVPGQRLNRPYYRLWADGTYGTYLWETLVGIAEELGGGPIGRATIAEIDQAPPR